MGLDCSHGAFRGAYSRFNRFKQYVAFAVRGSYPPHIIRTHDGKPVPNPNGSLILTNMELDLNSIYTPDFYGKDKYPGLHEFLGHSDCDGEISPEMCGHIYKEFKEVKKELMKIYDKDHESILMIKKFMKGCKKAHKNNEPLTFL